MSHVTSAELAEQKLLPEYLSSTAAARLSGVVDYRTVAVNVVPDAWELGPNGKRWPLFTRATIEAWIAGRKTAGK